VKADTKPTPSKRHLVARLDYDPRTGVLLWKPRALRHFANERLWRSWNNRFAGKPAGSVRDDGYITVNFEGKAHLAHRLIWKMHYGVDAPDMIDHKDQRPGNNRIRNLRLSDDAKNQHNVGLRADNTSGVKGVSWHNDQWRARIQFKGKPIFIGHFESIQAAETAIKRIRARLHKEFACNA
jgi:hypothetical protein